MQRTSWITITTTTISVIALDQASKALIVDEFGPDRINHRRSVLGSWFSLEYVQNRGAAFGLFANGGWLVFGLVIVGFVVLAVALRHVSRPSAWFSIAAGLVSGGAIGNAIDRLRIGHVTDFIAVGIWWRFNLADSAVTIGVLILIWLSMQTRDAREKG